MTEIQRQQWIGIALDLMVEYYKAQYAIYEEDNFAEHPDIFIRPMCERVAAAIGDGATAEFVYQSFHERLKSRAN